MEGGPILFYFNSIVREGFMPGSKPWGKNALSNLPLVDGNHFANMFCSTFIFFFSFECFVLKRDHADINVFTVFL